MITPSQREEYKAMSSKKLEHCFLEAIQVENLEKIKYFLTSRDLKCNVNVHLNEDFALLFACQNGNLPIVQFLLSDPELKENADIHAKNDYAIKVACALGHLGVVQYLLSSPELKEHADIYAENNSALAELAKNYSEPKMKKITSYLINEYQLDRNKVENIISNYPNLQKIFNKRDNLLNKKN